VGTESEHGSTRPDMNWHHSTGGYGGDRDNQGGYPDDRYPTRGPNRPGMYGGPGGDYGKFIFIMLILTENNNLIILQFSIKIR
jgi:hypothetical protein